MNPHAPPEDFVAFAAANSEPRFTEWLRRRSEPAWSEMIGHRFTRDMAGEELELCRAILTACLGPEQHFNRSR